MGCEVIDLGVIDYQEAYTFQKRMVEGRKFNKVPDTLIVAEHFPVLTLGRSGSRKNILVDDEALKEKHLLVYRVDRGGDVTYHGPGQLVIYPVFDLRQRGRDIHLYLRNLEGATIECLKTYNIRAVRREGFSGVWVGEEKIAFIGIGISRWVSYHGLAINIDPNPDYFPLIRSCGIWNIQVTSLSKILHRSYPMAEIKPRIVEQFRTLFDREPYMSTYGR